MNLSKARICFTGCLLALLCLAVPIKAGAANSQVFVEKKAIETEFVISTGMRYDHLEWSIAADSTGTAVPNILSELNFKDLKSYLFSLRNTTTIASRYYFRGEITSGKIFDGQTRDSDYLGNNRTMEFSRSLSDNSGDSVFDFSMAGGYRFNLNQDRLAIIPLIGYSYHEQNVVMSDGVQVIPPAGPFPDLNSTYEVEWSGPWIGVDVMFMNKPRPTSDWMIMPKLGFEMHWADYAGTGNWNLRRDLKNPVSFVQEADAFGLLFRAGLDLQWQDYWTFSFGYQLSSWETDDGRDTVFFSDGTSASTLFNGAEWTSHALTVGLGLRF